MPTALLHDSANAVFKDPRSFATSLFYLFYDRYVLADDRDDRGPESENGALDWLPDTIVRQIRADYGVELPPTNLKKLLTAISITLSDAFFTREDAFVPMANALADSDPEAGVFEPADAAECAWAVLEGQLLSQDGAAPWSPAVQKYIEMAIERDGLAFPPALLRRFWSKPAPEALDDPELGEGVLTSQTETTGEIDAEIAQNVAALAAQLEHLPLKRGNVKPLVEQLRKLYA
jgi:hypothetical protein